MSSLLAEIFLPETYDDPSYQKAHVVRLLIAHDVGEMVVGNILADEITEEDYFCAQSGIIDVDERLFFTGNSLARLVEEYEFSESINAKIAGDLDRLETYIQLRFYSLAYDVANFDLFKKDLRRRIKTKLVKNILIQVAEAFATR